MKREIIICDIKAVTHYKDLDFEGKSDSQLFAMRCRILADMDRYYREIVKYFKEHPEARTMSDEDLKLLNYNELSDLRNKLGLGRKKVTKTEPNLDTAKKGRKSVAKKSVKDLSLDIIKAQDEYERQETLLYMKEIIEMGYGDYTREELFKIGIIPLDMDEGHLKK